MRSSFESIMSHSPFSALNLSHASLSVANTMAAISLTSVGAFGEI